MSRFFFIAGEASGDLHASKLISSLKNISTNYQFLGMGGDRMMAAGCDIAVHYKKIAFMGFKEVLVHLPLILKTMRKVKAEISKAKPDIIILVDYPGFNFRIASWAKKQGFKIVYFIPPQVWAWKEKRVFKLKKYTDKIICILPFEKEFYQKYGMEVLYAGHPLADTISKFEPDKNFIEENKLGNKKLVALLPGSRKQEIERSLPVMVSVARKFPDYHFLLAATNDFSVDYYSEFIKGAPNIQLLFDKTYQLMHYAKAALVTSGTATLEAALFRLPMVVVYKTTGINYSIFKFFARVQYISLVNLVSQKTLVTELIQNEFNIENTVNALQTILTDKEHTTKMVAGFDELKKSLVTGEGQVYNKAAQAISQMI